MFDFHFARFARTNRSISHFCAFSVLTAACITTGFGCGSHAPSAPTAGASAPSDAALPATDAEKLTGRWRKNDCKMIKEGSYKTYYQASVLHLTPPNSEVIPTIYLDKECKKPAIQFQPVSTASIQVVSNIDAERPELIGLNVTPEGSTTVKYLSVILKDGTLRMSTVKRTSDGNEPEHRLIPLQTDPIYVQERLPSGSTVEGQANLTLQTVYQSECSVLKNETEGSERCTLKFNQAGNKFEFFRLGFVDANCTEPRIPSNYQLEPIEYQTLKLSNTEDGIFGYATEKTGFILQFHMVRGIIQLEGISDGGETITLTEVEN